MSDDLNTEIKIGADASGVEAGVSRAKRSLADLGKTAEKSGKDGGKGIELLGVGGDKAAQQVERATKNMQNSIQRQIAVMQAGSKESREYWEVLANQRGLNAGALKPYLDDLERVTKETNKAKQATESLGQSADAMGKLVGRAIAGITVGAVFKSFIAETVRAQDEQAQLGAVLKSTGQAAGFSADKLNAMSATLAKSSVFSAGDITGAQTRLLSYTGIVGEQFPRAMQNVIDMAQRMGMDVKSSAETIGRALDIPSEGLTALQRQGFRFSESQKELVKQLEDTGRASEAQAIILDALESSYGGAAAAAKGTLGGALKDLQNNIQDLMAGEGGGVKGMTSGINDLSSALGSPETKAAFQTVLGQIAQLSSSAVIGAANLLTFINATDKLAIIAGTDSYGKMKASAEGYSNQIVVLTDRALRFQEAIERGDRVLANQRNLEKTRERIAALQKQAQSATQALKDFANAGALAVGGVAVNPAMNAGVTASGRAREAYGANQAKAAADLNAFRLKQSGVTEGYIKDMGEIIRLNQLGVLVGKEYTNALKQQQDVLLKKSGVSSGAADAAKQEQSGYDKLIASIKAKIAQNDEEVTTGRALNESEKLRAKLSAEIEQGSRKMTVAHLAQAKSLLAVLDASEQVYAVYKAQKKFEGERDKEAASIAASISGINAKAQALEDEIAVYGLGESALQALTIARLEENKAIIAGFDNSAERVAQIDAEIEALTRLGAAKDVKKGLDDTAAQQKKMLSELDSYLDPAKATSFGDALTSAFEGAGNSLAALVSSLDNYAQKEAEIAKMRANLSAESDPAKRALKEIELANLSSKAQINAYATMAGAAKTFFKEGSGGYKAMSAVEKTYRAAELAMAVKNTAVKIGLISGEVAATAAGQAGMTAASNAGEASRMTAKIPGVFASFMSMMGPFGIPAAIAALAAVGIAASGSATANVLPATNEGKGTVFGDAGAKSESIGKTISLLEGISKFAGIGNSYAAKMLTSLRSIEQQIGGFTNVVLRSGGIDAAGASVAVGKKSFGIQAGPLDFIGKNLFTQKVSVTGQGLYANDATLGQIKDGGLDAGYYADINKKTKILGFTVSDKNSTQRTRDDEVSRQISSLLNSFADSVKLAAPVLGFALDEIDAGLQNFVVSIGRVDLKDLTGAEIQEKLNAVFGAAGDNIAKAAIPGLERLQQVGEGYFETLARVASNLSSVNQMFDTLGESLYASSIAGAEMSLALAQLFGGLENMSSVVGSYYQNFYSEGERKETLKRQMQAALDGVNLTLPDIDATDARAQFRALADAQDLTTEAGRKAYAALLGLNEAFSSVTENVADFDKELSDLSGAVTGFFASIRISIERLMADVAGSRSDILRGKQGMTAAEIRAAIGSTAVAAPSMQGLAMSGSAVQAAAAAMIASQSQRDAAKAAAQSAMGSFVSAQNDTNSAAAQLAAAQARKQLALSEAAKFQDGGEFRGRRYDTRKQWLDYWLPKADEAQREIEALQPALAAYQASLSGLSAQYQAAQSSTAAYEAGLAAAQSVLAAAQAAEIAAKVAYAAEVAGFVTAASGSVSKLSDLRGEVVSFYEAQARAVQGMVASAGNLRAAADKVRLDQLSGAQTAQELGSRYAMDYAMALATTGSMRAGYVDSMAGNISSLSTALKGEAATGADWRIEVAKLLAQASNASGLLEGDAAADDYKSMSLGLLDSIDSALSELSGATQSAEQAIADAIKNGTSAQLDGMRAIVAALKGEAIPAFAGGGLHAGGLRLVGERGPELEVTGPSRIFNAQQLAGAMGGGQSNARLENLVETLVEENRAQAAAIVRLQQDQNRLLQRWDANGMPEQRDVSI